MRGYGASIALGLGVLLLGFWYLGRGQDYPVPEIGPDGVPTAVEEVEPQVRPATLVGEEDEPPTDVSEVAPSAVEGRALSPRVTLVERSRDPAAAERGVALLEVVVTEGEAGTPLVNHPVRVEAMVFRPGRPVAPETRTDATGTVQLEVPADEGLRVLVLEEFRNVTMLEERTPGIAAGTVGKLTVRVPLPPIASMWVEVVADADGAPVADARVWIEKLLRIDGEPVLETYVETWTDRRGRARLDWPAVPAVGARAEKEGVGEARFVPVDQRGTETEPFEVRLGELPVRGDGSRRRR